MFVGSGFGNWAAKTFGVEISTSFYSIENLLAHKQVKTALFALFPLFI